MHTSEPLTIEEYLLLMAPKAEKASEGNPYGIEGEWYKARAPKIYCRDGFSVSVQGHPHAYARMRGDGWKTVELGFPNRWEELLDEFREYPNGKPTESVYPQVPVELVDQVLKRHGGIDLNATCRESKQWGMLTRS
jgi:hypothetical protein